MMRSPTRTLETARTRPTPRTDSIVSGLGACPVGLAPRRLDVFAEKRELAFQVLAISGELMTRL